VQKEAQFLLRSNRKSCLCVRVWAPSNGYVADITTKTTPITFCVAFHISVAGKKRLQIWRRGWPY